MASFIVTYFRSYWWQSLIDKYYLGSLIVYMFLVCSSIHKILGLHLCSKYSQPPKTILYFLLSSDIYFLNTNLGNLCKEDIIRFVNICAVLILQQDYFLCGMWMDNTIVWTKFTIQKLKVIVRHIIKRLKMWSTYATTEQNFIPEIYRTCATCYNKHIKK